MNAPCGPEAPATQPAGPAPTRPARRRGLRIGLAVLLAAAVVLSLAIAAVLVWGVPHDQVSLVIDGEHIDIPDLATGHWLVASAAVLVVLLVLLIVVPLMVAFALALPLTLVAIVLALGALGTLLALSPVLLLAALAWWLWRRRRRRRARSTIPA